MNYQPLLCATSYLRSVAMQTGLKLWLLLIGSVAFGNRATSTLYLTENIQKG